MLCDYDEAYSRIDAYELGWCNSCRITSCKFCKNKSKSNIDRNIIYMSPNDYLKLIDKKDAEINRLKKLVENMNNNIQIIGQQNKKLKKKCERYQNRLRSYHLDSSE